MESNSSQPNKNPLAGIAFALAVLLMIWPTEADILHPLFIRGSFGRASLGAAFFFLIVFTPFFFAMRCRQREPHTRPRSGRGLLIATGVILTLNFVWFGWIVVTYFFR